MDEHKPERTSVEPDITPPNENGAAAHKAKMLSKQVLVIIGIIVGIVLIAILTLWLVFSALRKNDTSHDLSKATAFDSPADLVASATASVKGYELEAATNDGLGGTTDDGYVIYSYPSLKIDGYDYRVQPLKGEGRGYSGDSITAEKDYELFTKFFADNHYKKTGSIVDNNGYISSKDSVTYMHYATYESDAMICSVWHADASQTDLKNHVASIGCADKASYRESASQLKPFYASYKPQTKASADELIFGTVKLSDAKVGYKNASVYQDDATIAANDDDNEKTFFHGLYYSAPGSSTWTYVDKYQGELPDCSLFKTDLLKDAFSGTKCTDIDNQTKTI